MIIRAKHDGKTSPYTIVSRDLLQENKLPYGPKCLLLLMLSYPDSWLFNEKHLANTMQEDIQTIRNWLAVLKNNGYVHRDVLVKFGDKDLPVSWLITENPVEVKHEQ